VKISEKKQLSGSLVSVGIPVYNGEKYIGEALDSMLNQTYTDWECNVVNNASTDNTENIVKKYAEKDKRIKLHNYKEFAHIVNNWNRTVLHISDKAKYFKILQADDWLDPRYLEEMVSVMEKYPTIGMCSSYRIDDTRVKCDGLNINDGQFYNGKEMLMRHIRQEIDITGSATTVLFKVEYLKKLPEYPVIHDPKDFHCDTQLAFDMMSVSDVGFVFQVLSYTRWHPDAYTSNTCVLYNTFLNAREIRLHKLRNIDPSIEKEYRIHRIKYAFFLYTRWLKRDKKCLKWHKDHERRPLTFVEYLKAFLNYNILSRQLVKIPKKLKRSK
jgi:glycosyltransferase involved in cell wall biosynthesis